MLTALRYEYSTCIHVYKHTIASTVIWSPYYGPYYMVYDFKCLLDSKLLYSLIIREIVLNVEFKVYWCRLTQILRKKLNYEVVVA